MFNKNVNHTSLFLGCSCFIIHSSSLVYKGRPLCKFKTIGCCQMSVVNKPCLIMVCYISACSVHPYRQKTFSLSTSFDWHYVIFPLLEPLLNNSIQWLHHACWTSLMRLHSSKVFILCDVKATLSGEKMDGAVNCARSLGKFATE